MSITSGLSGIKSIQRGTVTLHGVASATASITAVVLANSLILHQGQVTDATVTNQVEAQARVELTNTTTVTGYNPSGSQTVVLGFTVIEFYPGMLKSVQRGTITVTTSNTATITSVDVTKAVVFHLGQVSGDIYDTTLTRLTLTNATTVTATNGGPQAIVGYQVAEFYQ